MVQYSSNVGSLVLYCIIAVDSSDVGSKLNPMHVVMQPKKGEIQSLN